MVVAPAASGSAAVDVSATIRVNLTSTGGQAEGGASVGPVLSINADGRYVAFASEARNLVPGDTNNAADVFVRDRVAGTTERVSVAGNGTQANDFSYFPSISADGRYVAFNSPASNLVPGDTNTVGDVFVRDRVAGTTERVSVSSAGVQADLGSFDLAISGDGRYVAFASFAMNLVPGSTGFRPNVFRHDRVTGSTVLVSASLAGAPGNGSSGGVAISGDGRYVAFTSGASDLVSGDANNTDDVFVRDMVTGTTSIVSLSNTGAQGNGQSSSSSLAITPDGRYVAFPSNASNLVPGDVNGQEDVFVRDRLAGRTSIVSVSSEGVQGNDASFFGVAISANGRWVGFGSFATNLVVGDLNGQEDIFLRDRWAATTRLVSVSDNGLPGNGFSYSVAITADGTDIAFHSASTNLVAGDTNDQPDTFIRHRPS
jgi:Tol biopolymer transport system component